MKHGLMILTLCAMLSSAAYAMSFSDISSPDFQGSSYSVVAWGDVNADGFADLFMGTVAHGESRLFLSNGSDWTNASDEYEVNTISHVRSARFVDFNQDGRLDLFCLTDNEESAELYRQTENHRFQRVDLNLEDVLNIRSATWCDADNDGALDLLLSNRSELADESVLLVPSTDEFVEARGATGPFTETLVSQISPIDYDQDGDMDYFMSKIDGSTSLWVYEGGMYRDYGQAMNFPTKLAQTGITWADFNRDGNLDFFACGSVDNNCLFYQFDSDEQPCSFENMTDTYGLRESTKGATSAHAVDADGDGRMDIFLVRPEGNVLLMNRTSYWQPLDRATGLLLPDMNTQSCAWGDYDNDGDLDVAMACERNGIRMFRNDTENTNEFVGLKLCGPDNCMTPVLNCLISVEFPYGKQWAATSMYAGTVGNDLNVKTIYNPSWYHSEEWTVNILWPNGMVSTLTQMDIPLNGYMELHMPQAPNPGNDDFTQTPVIAPEVVNYPNPFNPATNIEFTLSAAANINLSIYNLLGQQVATLASGAFEAGLHSLTFDASALPSGLYLARLDTPNGSVVHRMLLTK